MEGDLAAKHLPVVPGHQIVGSVDQLGPGVGADLLGARVGVGWLASTCGHCDFCQQGRENLCRLAQFTGWDRDGGYASQALARADYTYRLPAGVGPVEAAPLLCGGIIGYRALKQTELVAGQALGLFGFGASALLVAQVARHRQIPVYVVTRGAQAQERARAAGAEWVGGLEDRVPVPLKAAITFAPVGSVVVSALQALDRGGVCVVNAIHLDRIPEFPYRRLYWERRLVSVANFTRQDSRELLELSVEVPIRTLTEVFPLEGANTALLRLKQDEVRGAAVIRI